MATIRNISESASWDSRDQNVQAAKVPKPSKVEDTEFVGPGWYYSPNGDPDAVYCIHSFDRNNPDLVHTRAVLPSGELDSEDSVFYLQELYAGLEDAEGDERQGSVPALARSLEELLDQLETGRARSRNIAPASADIPAELLDRADTMLRVVDHVEKFVKAKKAAVLKANEEAKAAGKSKERFSRTNTLRDALETLGKDQMCLVWYYEYLKRCRCGNWDRVQIASKLRRSTYNHSRLTPAQAHLVDKFMMRYYGGRSLIYYVHRREGSTGSGGRGRAAGGRRSLPPMRPSTVYRLMSETWERTGGYWIDPQLCPGQVREDVVAELMQPKPPMDALLSNAEKANLLSRIKLPSRGWFYNYLAWFKSQPGKGKKLIVSRYGKEMWESEYLAFDTFVSKATMPLQYVFADHLLIKMFIVDKEQRKYPVRLWLTLLIDAYSRAVLGMALLFEDPGIESIQRALRHAIWPKDPASEIDVEPGEQLLPWGAYGMSKLLSLDNAWAHHSHSLEDLVRQLSKGGRYTRIELEHRPPYAARRGALIERLFRNLTGQIRELVPGAIQSRSRKDLRDAAEGACLLYEDAYNIIYRILLNYQHTRHSEIGMSPYEKLMQGLRGRYPHVPPLDDETERLFWRMYPGTRIISRNGVSAFGLKYWSPELVKLPRVNRKGKKIAYSFRYLDEDISRLALFADGEWLCDVYAKRFREPDGTHRQVSLWAWETGSRLFAEDKRAGLVPDNVGVVDYVERLTKTRLGEQKRIQAAQAKGAGAEAAGREGKSQSSGRGQAPSAASVHAMSEALEHVRAGASGADETELLADFLG
ncbi:MAG: Mu transposase C-terminal domain-containing protein [Chloroflexota bacterium]|nr:Mu transposase C-terminal domain-containing protein [Chloroflexota bacterium]